MKRFLRNLLSTVKPAGAARTSPRARLNVEKLEDRQVLTTLSVLDTQRLLLAPTVGVSSLIARSSIVLSPGARMALEGIPSLSSRPSAPAALYLDFIGGSEAYWGNHGNTNYRSVTTGALDVDHDGSLSSAHKTAFATELYQRVAEMFSPFNLNVTTVDPGHSEHGKVMVVQVGDTTSKDGDPLGGAPGISFTGGFTSSSLPNVAFVAPSRLSDNAKLTAVAVAHETGHMLGLSHQSLWAGGRLAQEYNPGDGKTAPIMGKAYYSDRALWWKGPTDTSATSTQDDLSVLSGTTDGLGYYDDRAGHSFAAATNEGSGPGASFAADGVISRTDRADYYRFSISRAGNLSLSLAVADTGPTLHAKALLLNASGGIVASASSPTRLGASLAANNLAPGSYTVEVVSYGGYGDLGTYHLSVTCGTPLLDLRGAKFTFQMTAAPTMTAGWLSVTSENLYTGAFGGTFISAFGGVPIPVSGSLANVTTASGGTTAADFSFSGASYFAGIVSWVSYTGKLTGKGHGASGWSDALDGTLIGNFFGALPAHAKDY